MNTKSVAPKAPKDRSRRVAPTAGVPVRLEDLSVTFPRPSLFKNDDAMEPTMTVDGALLGMVLRWISMECPNMERFTHPSHVSLDLLAMAEECLVLGAADSEMIGPRWPEIVYGFGERLRELACRLYAGDTEAGDHRRMSVTIAAKTSAGARVAEPAAAERTAQ